MIWGLLLNLFLRLCMVGSTISYKARVYNFTVRPDVDFNHGSPPRFLKFGPDRLWRMDWRQHIHWSGVTIDYNSVVGTHSVPPPEIWGGIPARRLRAKRESL